MNIVLEVYLTGLIIATNNPKTIEVIKNFKVVYNENVNLYTIRNYKKDSVSQLLNNKKILLEQRSRNTIQLIAK